MEREVDGRLLDAVAQARAVGIRCVVATNQERYRVAYMRDQMRFDTLFDGVYSSAQLGVKKPDVRFFQAIMDDLAVEGSQIGFWDDSLANIEAARTLGWHAEFYTDYDHFTEQFQQVSGLRLA